MNTKILLIAVLAIGLAGCKSSGKKNQDPDFLNYSITDPEGLVTTQFDGVYRYFDYNNKDGLSYFCLIPDNAEWYRQQLSNTQGKDTSEKEEFLLEILNKKSFRELSEIFSIYVFHTGRKYLKATPELDFPYTPIVPRTIYLYELDFGKSEAVKIDSLNIKTEQDEAKESDWMDTFIKTKAPVKSNRQLKASFDEENYVIHITTDARKLTFDGIEFLGYNFSKIELNEQNQIVIRFSHDSGSQITTVWHFDDTKQTLILDDMKSVFPEKTDPEGRVKICELKNLHIPITEVDTESLFDRLTNQDNCRLEQQK